uniref:Tudor domain-containing protein 7 n=1 Tax=Anopheles culicifacies TaxID=139723 RepID=A0A182M524_9DIPT
MNTSKSGTQGTALSEEAQAAIAVVRALVASRKETSNVLSVLRDYRQLEGDSLPYRKFGFSTVEELLLASNEFVIKASAGESTRIYIKPNRDSAHIQEMVAAQKSTKSGGTGKKSHFVALRQPTGPSSAKGFSSQSTAYSRIYQQMPNAGRNNSTNYSPKRVTFGEKPMIASAKGDGKSQGFWSNGGSPQAKSQGGQMRPITKTKAESGAGRNSNSTSPEANNNSRSTKNYNLNGTAGQQQQLDAGDLRHKLNERNRTTKDSGTGGQQQLNAGDLRHKLNERNSTLSRSSVEMRQANKALSTVSSNAVGGVSGANTRQGVSVARKLPFSAEDKNAKKPQQQQKAPNARNASQQPNGGSNRTNAAMAGSGRKMLPLTAPTPWAAMQLMSIVAPTNTNVRSVVIGKSVNSRLNVAKAELPPDTPPTPVPAALTPAAAAAAATTTSVPSVPSYQRAQSLDERKSIPNPYMVGRSISIPQPPAMMPYIAPVPLAPKLPTLPGKKSLQDRLKINQEVADDDLEKVAKLQSPPTPTVESTEASPPLTNPQERTSKTALSSSGPVFYAMNQNGSYMPSVTTEGGTFSWDDPNATPVEILMRYSIHKGYARPEYGYYKLKSGRYQCLVMVNGSSYSTYPEDYVSQFEGQFAAALNAIEAIQRDESRLKYSKCLESDRDIAHHIHELLVNCPHGMFSKNIPKAFEETHRALLPDHWFAILDQYSNQLFVLEDSPTGDTIVFAREQPSGSDVASNTSEAREMAMNQLTLPWEEEYWNVYVTNPVSTVEVWARLVGKEYSDKMDSLITDIEMSMMNGQADAKKDVTAAVGEYYLVSISDCWFRVRVVEINYETNQCQCFFIDIGDSEQIALDQLYRCEPQYLELPAQAICFTLEGLEDFSENPSAKHILGQRINHRVLIGMILSKREEYERTERVDGIGSGTLKVVLYDTSSAEDEIVNPILLQQICKSMPVPELNRKSVNYVSITYVDDQGDVYCQMDGAMNYIQKLITNLTQSDALEDQHRGLYNSKATEQQLYLVQDETDSKWYRAVLDAEESGPFCRMLYVDIGCRRRANVQNIYRLDRLSLGLRSYPPQAIRMRMFELPGCGEPQILARLRAFLKPAVPAMAKVFSMASAILPLVKLYVHVSDREAGNNILVCVNEAIKIEKELEMGSERINLSPRTGFPDDDKSSFNGSGSDTTAISQSTGTSYSMSSTDGKDLANRFNALHVGGKGADTTKSSSGPLPTLAAGGGKAIAKLAKITLPAVGQVFNVKVTIANNPKFFFVQPYAYLPQLDTLMHELQDFCMTKAQPVRKEHVRQGEAYAAVNNLGHWYRALVVNINPFGPTPIHAYFCDFGQVQQLDAGALRVLPAEFRVLPQQAIKAKLYGVKPLHNDWTISDAMRFKELTADCNFASVVRSIQADELNPQEQLIELELIDVSTENDVFVHKILVDEGRAVYTAAAHTV